MKKLSVLLTAIVAAFIMSCASEADKKIDAMFNAMGANDTPKIQQLVNELGDMDESQLSGENKACVAIGYAALAVDAASKKDSASFYENRNLFLGLHEALKEDKDYKKVAEDLKTATGNFDLFALAESFTQMVDQEAKNEVEQENAENGDTESADDTNTESTDESAAE